MTPAFLLPGSAARFPDPGKADADGLVAVGGDLSVKRLLRAYESGIFPWYDEGLPPLWWSPDPRMVFAGARVHVARRLARTLRQGRFRITWNRAFEQVMRACADRRPEGTWILPEMVTAYVRLHARGHAHSLEVWGADDELVGGIYGVQRGALFAAESMFHAQTDASKVALVACVRTTAAAGIELFDAQLPTPHLERMGAEEWPRERYLAALGRVIGKDVSLADVEPRWE